MDPKFQTSFIPKNPAGSQSKLSYISIPSINIFATISTVLLFLTVILIGGLFGYEYFLNRQIEAVKQEIVNTNQASQIKEAKEIIAASSRIVATKGLLDRHVTASALFELLQTLTLKKISYSGFLYNNKEGLPTVSTDAEAQSYNSLAQQQEVFLANSFIKNPKFSGFTLADNGNIKTKFTTTIDPTLISYKKAIEELYPNQ